ncbi:hypothetical protein DdX_12875 [Ditylenchus destructor]|uniref:Uncharacterized protein n=1 Tax=Ditylenchus destructor TaxID=166010 RepID=A0AAD4R3A5_9BILA|nr:hypothetical protein DdX_12875 [Ditylenchus destructor]
MEFQATGLDLPQTAGLGQPSITWTRPGPRTLDSTWAKNPRSGPRKLGWTQELNLGPINIARRRKWRDNPVSAIGEGQEPWTGQPKILDYTVRTVPKGLALNLAIRVFYFVAW